jgi:hypothetical protein
MRPQNQIFPAAVNRHEPVQVQVNAAFVADVEPLGVVRFP